MEHQWIHVDVNVVKPGFKSCLAFQLEEREATRTDSSVGDLLSAEQQGHETLLLPFTVFPALCLPLSTVQSLSNLKFQKKKKKFKLSMVRFFFLNGYLLISNNIWYKYQ